MKMNLDPNPKRFEKDAFNISIDSLMNMYQTNTFDFDAPYQRGLVWNDFQKEELISSIVEWIPINAIYWNEYSESQPLEIIDGKQRLTTIIDFFSNKFKWKGYYYSELPSVYQSLIRSFSVSVYLTKYKTTEKCVRLFERINYYGTPHQ